MDSEFILKELCILYTDNSLKTYENSEKEKIFVNYNIDGPKENFVLNRAIPISDIDSPKPSLLRTIYKTIVLMSSKIKTINIQCEPNIILSLDIRDKDNVYVTYNITTQDNNQLASMENLSIFGGLMR